MGHSGDQEHKQLLQKHIQHDTHSRESGENKDEKETVGKIDTKTIVIGYLLLLLLMGLYSVAIMSAQITGGKMSMFEMNIFRFALLATSGIIGALYLNYSVVVAKTDVYKFAIAITCNYVPNTFFYVAAAFLPVGNMDGVYGGIYIILSTCVDLYRKQISRLSIVASGLACIGLVMLTQFWRGKDESANQKIVPCDYMDNRSLLLEGIEANYSNASSLHLMSSEEANWTGFLLGYMLVIFSASCATVSSNIYRSLLQTYSIYSVLFWGGLVQCAFSAAIVIGQKYLGNGHLAIPTKGACLGFVITFILSAALTTLVGNIVYKLLPISKVAIATPFATVALYFVQRTLLKKFHPGHKNIMEIIGIISIFCAGTLSPVISLIFEKKADKT